MTNLKYTTIETELKQMEEVVAKKVHDFEPAKNCTLVEKIFHLFKSSSKARIDGDEKEKIFKVIEYYVEREKPIKISFLWAIYWMVQSPWIFLEKDTIKPRLGDYWAPYWLSMINKKLKKIFPPGCEFYIIDEQEMIKMMGWTKKKSLQKKSFLKPIYAQFDFIKIINLPKFDKLPKIKMLNYEEIIATIISTPSLFKLIPENTMRQIMDALYIDRDKISKKNNSQEDSPKSYGDPILHKTLNHRDIRKIIPNRIWVKASQIKEKMNQIGLARKMSPWLNQEIMKSEPFIDGAVTIRGRWSPNIWAFTTPQHGGSILDLKNKLYSISIIPEYRLKESEKYEPVMVKNREEEYILYWIKKEDNQTKL